MRSLCMVFLLCVGQAVAQDRNMPLPNPNSAAECLARFVENAEQLRSNTAVYAHMELVETKAAAEGTLNVEWFRALSESPDPVHYVESRYLYSVETPTNGYWERCLSVGRDKFYHFGWQTRPLKHLSLREEFLSKSEDEQEKLIEKTTTRFRVPSIVFSTIIPNTAFIARTDTHANMVQYVHTILEPLEDQQNAVGFAGSWHTHSSFGMEMEFDQEQGYMPTRVRGYYLNRPGKDEPISPLDFGKVAYDISATWQPIDRSSGIYVPVHVVNTVHRLNPKTDEGREIEVHAAWKRQALSTAELNAESLNEETQRPGRVAEAKFELQQRLADIPSN